MPYRISQSSNDIAVAERRPFLKRFFFNPIDHIYSPSSLCIFTSHISMARCGFCCCYWFFSISIVLCSIALIIIVIVVQPVNVKFHVVNASLSEFNFITNNNVNTMVYNLSIEASVRNPNKKIGYYYHRIDAKAFYEKKQFAYLILSDRFYQGHKNTTMLHILFQGNSSIPLRGSKLEKFSRKFDKAKNDGGVFKIYIRFGVQTRYKIGHYKSGYYKPKIHCDLKVPLLTNGTSTVIFRTTTCDVGSPLAMEDGEE
ncbi:hypothetical protein AQUCO_00700916v1 [Aquilegia coerulea]|uniref:Uncharacterized protein n=1 Tax=Aquilegia coerulea TaxID=218851 RepID=A0A2G5EMV0_AQUCA|nr:hypothetical protein AQUCO_00700916v1 [Aquilegia coerulea]